MSEPLYGENEILEMLVYDLNNSIHNKTQGPRTLSFITHLLLVAHPFIVIWVAPAHSQS